MLFPTATCNRTYSTNNYKKKERNGAPVSGDIKIQNSGIKIILKLEKKVLDQQSYRKPQKL